MTKETTQPRWTSDDRLTSVTSDLFVIYQHPGSGLLFICSSRRNAGLYDLIAEAFVDADPRPLPLVRLNRVLNDINSPEFFNVGMRNRIVSNTTELYQIITGSSADKTINKSDGRLYHAGHAFGRGEQDGEAVTIGLSSASKVWSNRSDRIPQLIEWCSTLAVRIATNQAPITMSGMDYLDVGQELDELPDDIIRVDWPAVVYKNSPLARFAGPHGDLQVPLVDFDIEVDLVLSSANAVMVKITHELGYSASLRFSLKEARFFEWATDDEQALFVLEDRNSESNLVAFVNDELPCFYTADLALLEGSSYLQIPPEDNLVFDVAQMATVDWNALSVDVQREFGEAAAGKRSIHAGLEAMLIDEDNEVVYDDHGSGEMADFVGLAHPEGRLLVQLYHCKGSSEAAPGHRVGDCYEVVSQATKSVVWALKQRVVSDIVMLISGGWWASFCQGEYRPT